MSYNKEQKASIWNLIKGSLFIGAFGFLTAWFMFNIAWLFRMKGKRSWFWGWMDDERINETGGWASDYSSYIIKKGGNPTKLENWWIAWNWHTRNSVWNLRRKYYLVDSTPTEVGNNNIDVVKIVTDNYFRLTPERDKIKLPQDGIWIVDSGLKYLPKYEWEDVWQVNNGDIISYRTSILGEGMIWFKAKGKDKLMFRYSKTSIVTYSIFGITIWKGWRTVKLGYGNMSYVMTIKHQKIKPWA